MWRVIRICELGLIGQDTFKTFEKAKVAFRKIVATKLGAGVQEFTKRIDVYCNEFYPQGAPKEFEQLKEIITRIATEPNFPEKLEDLKLDDFEDDNVEFHLDPFGNLFVYVNNEEVKEKFINAEIKIFESPFESDYYFFITDNRDGFKGEHWYTNITLEETKVDTSDSDWDDTFDNPWDV